MKSLELRKKFFDYFIKHGHEKVASSSLIPAQDPTILFTNAGMNQFKDLFLGLEQRSYKRAVSIQKCVRAGGKHNDLENVGFTQRHLTFFEMMGNFSFGDYFKQEAIEFAWNFLTKEVGFDESKMYVSVHFSDDESYDIWHQKMGIPKEKIFKLGESNFWQMGDVGPCGPCTEIFVDRGSAFGCGLTTCDLACGCDRFLEVWNNVFMQFNRQADGSQVRLAQTGVDTGMGLERLTMIVQNKESVFATDLFDAVFAKIEELTGYSYTQATPDIKAAFNVLGDHVRSSTFLIADGCAPSNDGRGYVLRKIIRRAALFAQKLTNENIFPQLASVLIDDMASVYPELKASKDLVISVLTIEVERFANNLLRGQKMLLDHIATLQRGAVLSASQTFTLYDTYGFPLEVTKLIAQEHGLTVDELGFQECMEQQREKSGKKMKQAAYQSADIAQLSTQFTGYTSLVEHTTVSGIFLDTALTPESAHMHQAGMQVWIITPVSPLYVACGGQVNDKGVMRFGQHEAEIQDLKKMGDAIAALITLPCDVSVGDEVIVSVDEFTRLQTMKNHTATHLLQAALQSLLGKSVKQAGSLVTPDYLRFDYTYHQPLSASDIDQVEQMINQAIWDNIAVSTINTTYKDAIAQGVIAFFGDKYNPENVRAVKVGTFSAELCGGTHVRATGDIGIFKIIEDTALAAGQRRIVALTGDKALKHYQQSFGVVKKLVVDYKQKPDTIVHFVQNAQESIKQLTKDVQVLKQEMIRLRIPALLEQATLAGKISFGCYKAIDNSVESIRYMVTQLASKKEGVFMCYAQQSEHKDFVVIGVSGSLQKDYSLIALKNLLIEKANFVGGGSGLMLQGSCSNVALVEQVVKQWLATL